MAQKNEDLATAKSLDNKHWVLIIIFLLTAAVAGTNYFNLKTTAQGAEHPTQLEFQRVVIEQAAFNKNITRTFERIDKTLDKIDRTLRKCKK